MSVYKSLAARLLLSIFSEAFAITPCALTPFIVLTIKNKRLIFLKHSMSLVCIEMTDVLRSIKNMKCSHNFRERNFALTLENKDLTNAILRHHTVSKS
jgi:hypothetical protein